MRIISGGQTGADRAGLDAAIELGMDYGGALPEGRRTEDGALDKRYDKMTELSTPDYAVRTERNIKDSSATLVFTLNRVEGGTALTIDLLKHYNKPYLHIELNKVADPEAVKNIRDWLKKINPEVLNIAGSRESRSHGIYDRVYSILLKAL